MPARKQARQNYSPPTHKTGIPAQQRTNTGGLLPKGERDMYYITGDTHGNCARLLDFSQEYSLTAEDTIIILGDAGLNYYADERDIRQKQLLQDTPATVFCIHGNHERRPQAIAGYRQLSWHGGAVYQEDAYPNLLFAQDGESFDFDGLSVIVIGGAFSVDKDQRLQNGWNWFADEQPDEQVRSRVEAQLERLGWQVDIVLSHTCPLRYEPREAFLDGIDQAKVDKSTELWLDEIEARLQYRRWYCGHHHTTKRIDRLQFMYKDYDMLGNGY